MAQPPDRLLASIQAATIFAGRDRAKTYPGGKPVATDSWSTQRVAVASLQLDAKNPRLGRETAARAPRELIQYLFEHDRAMEVAASIASRGYFPNEPLLAFRGNGRFLVVEGNRRLAALKALREPGLLEGPHQRQIERLSRRIPYLQSIARVPATIESGVNFPLAI